MTKTTAAHQSIRALERIARRRHGIFRRDHVRRAGMSNSVFDLLLARGVVQRIRRGVYAFGCVPTDRRAIWMASIDAAGEGAALSGVAAAAAWNVTRRDPRRRIDIVVPRRHAPMDGVHLLQSSVLDDDEVTKVDALSILVVERLLVELAALGWEVEELCSVIDEAAFWHVISIDRVRLMLVRHARRRNIRRVREALELWLHGDCGSKSGGEMRTIRRLRRVLTVPYEVNRRRRFAWKTMRPDLYIESLGIAVETDGGGHGRPTRRRDDADRDAA